MKPCTPQSLRSVMYCRKLFHLFPFYLHKQLKDKVYSPAGTSIQAIQMLEKAGLRGLFMEAVQTACKRAAELSRIENGETQDYALKIRWTTRTSFTFNSIQVFRHTMSVILNKFVEFILWFDTTCTTCKRLVCSFLFIIRGWKCTWKMVGDKTNITY